MPRAPGLRAAAILAGMVALLSCTTPASDLDEDVVAAEATMQPADKVDLTVYYRHGRGTEAHLVPVVREVPVEADLPRRALQQLLRGPTADDPPELAPALPPQTRILGFGVRDGTAAVDLSGDVVSGAAKLRRHPEHEVLALAALANTLTEFPAITRVELSIDGQRPERFWGPWGVPTVLVRDNSVIEPRRTRGVIPDLSGFSSSRQRVGVARQRPPVVRSVTVKPRTTYLRVSVEVTEPDGSELVGPVPPSLVRRSGENVVLTVRAAPGDTVPGDLTGAFHDPVFPRASADVRGDPRTVVVTIAAPRRSDFWLHTLGEPARVVLDIRR